MASIFKKGLNTYERALGIKNDRPPDVAGQWNASHQVDPNTGQISGPPGAIPQEVGMDVQAQHERGVWNQKNRLGQSASQWAQGALGLLQSYRPGGGATLESGIYQGLANIDLQRSQMLQPLDLLGPYREEQARKARKATAKAGMISAIGGIAGTVLGAAVGAPGVAGPTAPGAQPPPLAPGQYGPEQVGQGRLAGPPAPGPNGAESGYAGQAFLNPGFGQAMSQLGGPPGGAAKSMVGGPSGGPASGPVGAGAPGPSGPQPSGPGSGSPGGSSGQEQRRGGPSGGPGGAGGGGVGSDGNFEPIAWAARAAGDAGPLAMVQQVHLSGYVAHLIESDPAWGVLDVAYQQEVAARVS